MFKSITDDLLSFSKPPKRLRAFLQRKKTLVHGSGPVSRENLRDLVMMIESGKIKTHSIKDHVC